MSPHLRVCAAVIVIMSAMTACASTEPSSATPPPAITLPSTPTLAPPSPTATDTQNSPGEEPEPEALDPSDPASLDGVYLGLEPPGKDPLIFAPGIISVDANFEHSAAVFSPDNREVYWSTNVNWYTDEQVDGNQRLFYMRMHDGEWTDPQIAPFSEKIQVPIQRTVFSPDGNILYYEAFSDPHRESDTDIFVIERIGEGWSDPLPVSPLINTADIERLHCVDSEGSLYFSRNPFTSNEEIFVSRLVDGAFTEPEELGEDYNSPGYEMAILLGPEEEYMLIESTDDQRSSFLTISYKKADGSWSDRVRTPYECGGFLALSPDGEYLFFLGRRGIYWVSTSFIDDLKPVTFTESEQDLGLERSMDVAMGDLDGDGDLDALIANEEKAQVWTNDGAGLFTRDQELPIPSGWNMSLELGDLDGDGDLDAFVVVIEGAGRVLLNAGGVQGGTEGHLEESKQLLDIPAAFCVALGDLDDDGDLDAFVGQEAANTVWLNDGQGGLNDSGQRLGEEITAAAAIGDLDGDGDLDVLAGGWDEPARVWFNDGTGTLSDSGRVLTPAEVHIHGLDLGDLDGDGDLDAILAVASGHPHQVWLNDGSGLFTDSGQALYSTNGHGVALGDLDGDGDLDAFIASGTTAGSGNTVWLNDGTGQMSMSAQRLGSASSRGIALGDLDGDSDLDALVANTDFANQTAGRANELWFNDAINHAPDPSSEAETTDSLPTPLVLTGRLIDGTGADPIRDGVVVIQGQKIVSAGSRAAVAIPRDADFLDLGEATILPGFINTHVHNTINRGQLETWLQAGVTTLRDLGAPYNIIDSFFKIRRGLDDDPDTPRVLVAGPLVTVPDGYPMGGLNFSSLAVTSPEDARQKIGILLDKGVAMIKITLESSAGPILSPEEASAIVETAHLRGVPVSAHVTNPADLQRAVDAGVDDIAHMVTGRVPEELILQMVAQDIAWVPTLDVIDGERAENLLRFVEAGGRVALGNDAGYLAGLEIGMPIRELEAMQAAGMSPMQVILAATRDAAYVCRVEESLGTLEAGKVADILVVDGDPLEDLGVLTEVLLVVHQGNLVRQEIPTG